LFLFCYKHILIVIEDVTPVSSTTTTTNYSRFNETLDKMTSLQTTDTRNELQSLDDHHYVTEHKRTLKQVRFVKDEDANRRTLRISKSLNNLIEKFEKRDVYDEDERCVISGSGYIVRGSNSEILNLNNISSDYSNACSLNDLLCIDKNHHASKGKFLLIDHDWMLSVVLCCVFLASV
jgi:hypothetical protein